MTRRKLHYPKIPGTNDCPGDKCIAFEKYDGTNLHFQWERDFGWHAYGARRDEFNLTPSGIAAFSDRHQQLRQAADVFHETLEPGLNAVLRDNSNYEDVSEVTVFAEFLGPNSFAGRHEADDVKELRLFDVWIGGFGMIGPEQFVADFGALHSARVVYRGKFTGALTENIRNGKFDVQEGVVCKGGQGGDDIWMAKVKTYEYKRRLLEAFGEGWDQYWE